MEFEEAILLRAERTIEPITSEQERLQAAQGEKIVNSLELPVQDSGGETLRGSKSIHIRPVRLL
jgi:hypothetical protein